MRNTAAQRNPDAWSRLFSPPIAHRGLWSASGAPENSLAAFEAACDGGYGIELDVQLSADGEAMVFHDEHLARMAGAADRLGDRSAAQLSRLRLRSTRETIPTLAQALDLVDGRSLVLVEIKSRSGEEGPLDEAVSKITDGYSGCVAVIGFNPGSQAWWRRHRPQMLRGFSLKPSEEPGSYAAQSSEPSPSDLDRLDPSADFLVSAAALVQSAQMSALRQEGWPIVAWTLRSAEAWSRLQPSCDNLIFEGFTP